MPYNHRPELGSLTRAPEPVDPISIGSEIFLADDETDILNRVAVSNPSEIHPSRVNVAAKACARVAFAKHIATWSFLTDPEAFFNLQD